MFSTCEQKFLLYKMVNEEGSNQIQQLHNFFKYSRLHRVVQNVVPPNCYLNSVRYWPIFTPLHWQT